MKRLAVALVFLVACSRRNTATARHVDSVSQPVAVEGSATRKPGGTDSIVTITGPTFISSMPITRADLDSSADANEALGDYQYYLSLAAPVLRKSGVRVELTGDSVVRWRDSLGVHSLSASDSGGSLYLFVLPNGRRRALRGGVRDNDDLFAAARELFRLPIQSPKLDSVAR
jgi:hypothetical protein